MALEAGAQEPLLGDACDSGLRDWIEIIADGLRRDGFDADDADRRAELVIATLEGAIVIAKARRDAGAGAIAGVDAARPRAPTDLSCVRPCDLALMVRARARIVSAFSHVDASGASMMEDSWHLRTRT